MHDGGIDLTNENSFHDMLQPPINNDSTLTTVPQSGADSADATLRHSTRHQKSSLHEADYIHAHIGQNDALGTNDDIAVDDNITLSDEIATRSLEYIMMQYNLAKGFKLYEKQGEQATQKELRQLHDKHTIALADASTLTYKDKKQ